MEVYRTEVPLSQKVGALECNYVGKVTEGNKDGKREVKKAKQRIKLSERHLRP